MGLFAYQFLPHHIQINTFTAAATEITTLLSNMTAGLIDGPMLNSIPDDQKGGYSGLRLMITNIGTSLGIMASGSLLQYFSGYRQIYSAAAILLLIQILLFEYGFKKTLFGME